ncbi:DNA-binding transcriptional regulator LsrR (DeoR family) [Actinomycetospora succinea]|uniref:DNA-binding transcriptional regulator LsrR (DeoR family) n=1 Tax=Actinomycetospora succinea TaxID=663603 RepID=A0A4R6VYG7_9PSEU|nr:sugar-binding domain-containing protein [Actinomycetospora succinea]TDQ65635.1 DNA-binding transcriptional regulator LsrR (DeoR family) [Actinomycetospora succinea]
MSTSVESAGWGPGRRLLAATAAHRFHVLGRTKVEIARELDMSRFVVARLLDAAQEQGLVRIEVTAGDDLDHRASEDLAATYGLRRALVAPRDGRSLVAGLTAELLTEIVGADDVLGLAWSRTINEAVDALTALPPCTVVQLCGAYSLPWRSDTSAETVARVGALCGGPTFPIYAPLVLPDDQTARTLREQPGVADAFGRFADLTIAVISVGAWSPEHSTVHDVLDADERAALADRGVVGEVVALPFDADGRVLDVDLARRVLAIDEAALRAVREVIVLVAEPERARAADALLRSGLGTTLVTDAATARALQETAQRQVDDRRARS